MTIFFFIFRLTILSGVSSCGTCYCVRAVRCPEVRAAVSHYAGGGQHPSAAGDGFFYRGRSAALRSVLLFRLRASSFLHAQKGTKDALKNRMVLKDLLSWCPEGGCRTPRRIKIGWTLSRLLPPPGGDRFPGAPDGKAPHCGGALRAGYRMRAGLGSAPTKGPGSAAPRPSPLEKGAVAAKGGDWGFLVSCRGHGERRRKKPSVTASPCHLPFQGRFFETPPNRWRAVLRTPGYRSNAEVFGPQPQPSSKRREPPLPTLPPRPVGCARAGAPRGGRRPRFLPGQAPVDRKGERPATRSPRAGSNRQTPDMGPPSPVMGVFRGAGHMCFRRERQRRRKYIRPVPRNASLLTFSAGRKYLARWRTFF